MEESIASDPLQTVNGSVALDAPSGRDSVTARRRRWTRPSARLGLLAGGALCLALAAWIASPGGILLRPHDFSPQAHQGRPDLAWAFSSPDGLRWEQFMVTLRCDTPNVTAQATFHATRAGPVTIWVAFPPEAPGRARPSLHQGGRDFTLIPEPRRNVRDLSVTWLPYTCSTPLAAGPCGISMTASQAACSDAPAWFGEILVRPAGTDGPPLRGLRLLARLLRTIGLALLALAILPTTVLGQRRLLRCIVVLGLASFVDRYLPTATWGWSDDDWYMVPDQSGLLEGDLRALLESHNGHILPAHRILWQACYLIGGTSGFPMRFISALWTAVCALLLLRLLRRWTRSDLAAAVATAFYLASNWLHDQSITIIAATNFSWAAGGIVAAMFCFDRYLRRPALGWLAATAVTAVMAGLQCAAGIVVFPALLMQYLCLAPRRRWRWSRRLLVGSAMLGALAAVGAVYHWGEPPLPGAAAHWPANGAAWAAIGRHCWDALLVGLQLHWPAYSLSPRAALITLVFLLAALCLPQARRLRRVWVAGGVIVAAGYAVVFGIRVGGLVVLSHYHVVAYIGIAILGAAAIAAYTRVRWLHRPLGIALCALLVVLVVHGIHMTERTYPLWEDAYRRQDRLIAAVAQALRRAQGPPESPYLSDDRIRYLMPSTRISISHLAATIAQRRYCDHMRQEPHPTLNLELPLVRDILRALAREYIDGLWPPSRESTLLVADADVQLPTAEFLRARRAPGVSGDVFVRLALPYELERWNCAWGAWLTRGTRLDVYSAAGGTLRIRCELRPGPSNPTPKRTITVTRGDQQCVWKLTDSGPTPCAAEFTVQPGTNTITLRVKEKRTIRKLPGGDTRELMLGCRRIELELGPAAQSE